MSYFFKIILHCLFISYTLTYLCLFYFLLQLYEALADQLTDIVVNAVSV